MKADSTERKAAIATSRLHCPGGEELRRFMRGELPRREVLPVVHHLLTGCPECVVVTRRLWNLGERTLRKLEETGHASYRPQGERYE